MHLMLFVVKLRFNDNINEDHLENRLFYFGIWFLVDKPVELSS